MGVCVCLKERERGPSNSQNKGKGILEHFWFFTMNSCPHLTYQIAVRKLTSLVCALPKHLHTNRLYCVYVDILRLSVNLWCH